MTGRLRTGKWEQIKIQSFIFLSKIFLSKGLFPRLSPRSSNLLRCNRNTARDWKTAEVDRIIEVSELILAQPLSLDAALDRYRSIRGFLATILDFRFLIENTTCVSIEK